MELTAQDIRDVRFGTTRMRAGYDMTEVDAFLDAIESAITFYSAQTQTSLDEADALRSQVQQLQARLASAQAELDECRQLASQPAADGHDTIITVVASDTDGQTTAENPVVKPSPSPMDGEGLSALIKVRDDVRRMLTEQLRIVDDVRIDQR